jgi:hypothetical protein
MTLKLSLLAIQSTSVFSPFPFHEFLQIQPLGETDLRKTSISLTVARNKKFFSVLQKPGAIMLAAMQWGQ